MAVLRKVGELSNKLFVKKIPFIYITRGHRDSFSEYLDTCKPFPYKKYIPGLYPITEEERRQAALKYGLHPDEYKPLPFEDKSVGDYPDLPWISVEAKDPYYPWDFPTLRRNFDEPFHEHFDMMGDDRFAYGVRQLVDYETGCCIFLALAGAILLIFHFAPHTRIPVMQKQYPRDGVHYSFEPAV